MTFNQSRSQVDFHQHQEKSLRKNVIIVVLCILKLVNIKKSTLARETKLFKKSPSRFWKFNY